MSTVKAVNLQHPNSSNINMVLGADGSVSGGLPSPNRNLLINGAMNVAQRGTSSTAITAGGYLTVDRWVCPISSAGTWTQTVESDAPTGSGFTKSLKMLCTTANASLGSSAFALFRQGIEGQDLQRVAKGTASAKQLTLSFWVKSNVTGTYAAYLNQDAVGSTCTLNYTVSSSATWEYKTLTFPADVANAIVNTNAVGLWASFGLAGGSSITSTTSGLWGTSNGASILSSQVNVAAAINNYWQITGVQLEVGPAPTPFEFKSYAQELRECQRYYWRQTGENIYSQFGTGAIYGATGAAIDVSFPVPMRVATISVEFNLLNIMNYGITSYAVTTLALFGNRSGTNRSLLTVGTAGGMTAGQFCFLTGNNSAASYLGFSAEL
jgi:hypothetical protein